MRLHPQRLLPVLALALAMLGTLGCAGGLAALGDSDTERAIEEAASDTSFPSAAEAGVAGSGSED